MFGETISYQEDACMGCIERLRCQFKVQIVMLFPGKVNYPMNKTKDVTKALPQNQLVAVLTKIFLQIVI